MLERTHVELEGASDEELAVLALHSAEAQAVLLKRYLKLVRYHAGRYASALVDAEDLMQEGSIALLQAVSGFDPEHGSSFSAFAQTCMINKMRSVVRRSGSCAAPVADIVQIMDEKGELADAETPESILLDKENYAHCRMQVMALLSAKEWEILQCILAGATYAKAAEQLGISLKSVDNAMQRVRRKMRAVRSTEYFE